MFLATENTEPTENNALFGEFCVLCGGFISTHKKSGMIAAFVASQSQNYFSL